MFSFFKKKKPLEDTSSVEKREEDYNDVSKLAKYFYDETGITFETQLSILKSKLTSFCKQREIYSFDELLQKVNYESRIKQELIDYLTTNETFFYREFKQIQELVALVKSSHSFVKILCAPSATGEEPYSIAIAILEAGVSASQFKIVGIDINSHAITKAKDAVYTQRHIQNLSPQVLQKYFHLENGNYHLKGEIKSLVSFEIANIFDDKFHQLGKFDFVFSRNMLIYFDQETKQKAKKILENMRKDTTQGVFFGHADLF